MKNTRRCPKCGSKDIVIVDGWIGGGGSGNYVPLGATVFSFVNIDRYICCGCGFTEEWINIEDIEKVKRSKKAHR